MAIINIFNKEKEGKKEKKATKPKKSAPIKDVAKGQLPASGTPKAAKRELDKVYRIIRNPHITEKATRLSEMNQYIFKVVKGANKPEVKKAVEDYYGVNVTGVKMVNIPSRTRKRGKGVSVKEGYRKAIVVVAKGQKIELLPR
jgi:large subunit ribosomal protein L23